MNLQTCIIATIALGALLFLVTGCPSQEAPEQPAEPSPATVEAPAPAPQQGAAVQASADLKTPPAPAEATDTGANQTAEAKVETAEAAGAEKGAETAPVENPDKKVDPNAITNKAGSSADAKKPVKKGKEIPNRRRPRTVLSGCFTNPDARQGGGMRATPGAGPGQREGVTVSTQGEDTIVVKHNLTHNCCYKAKVDTKIMKHLVHVTEKLSGEACRCKCSSTIKTLIPVGKGNYSVTVDLKKEGKAKMIHEAKVSL